MTKKTRQLARKSALSLKGNEEAVIVIDDFTFDEPKTKKVTNILDSLDIQDKKVIILTAETDKVVYKSARNIPSVEVLEANKPSTYQILNADIILIQESAVNKLEGSFETEEVVA